MDQRSPSRCELHDDFGRTWEEHATAIFRVCLRHMGGNRGDAEEACARTALKALRHFRSAHRPKAWLLRLAANCCIDIHRERKRKAEVSWSEAEPEPVRSRRPLDVAPSDPERDLLRSELDVRLHLAIEALPDAWKQVVRLRLEEQSDRMIAVELGISEANVRKRAQLAREALRVELK